jgi:hypothetical protein
VCLCSHACGGHVTLHVTDSSQGVHLLLAAWPLSPYRHLYIQYQEMLRHFRTLDGPHNTADIRSKASRMTSTCCLASDASSSSSEHSESSELLQMKTVDPGPTEIDHVSLLPESLRLPGESRSDEGESLGVKEGFMFLGVEGASLGIDARSESVL